MNFVQNFTADFFPQLEYLLRIVIACLCGGFIGIERTLRQKDAGFRTHVIVALGAALMMVVSKYGFADSLAAGYDPSPERIASNIITGISFLGAGMIFVRGANIKGLTRMMLVQIVGSCLGRCHKIFSVRFNPEFT